MESHDKFDRSKFSSVLESFVLYYYVVLSHESVHALHSRNSHRTLVAYLWMCVVWWMASITWLLVCVPCMCVQTRTVSNYCTQWCICVSRVCLCLCVCQKRIPCNGIHDRKLLLCSQPRIHTIKHPINFSTQTHTQTTSSGSSTNLTMGHIHEFVFVRAYKCVYAHRKLIPIQFQR